MHQLTWDRYMPSRIGLRYQTCVECRSNQPCCHFDAGCALLSITTRPMDLENNLTRVDTEVCREKRIISVNFVAASFDIH